MDDFQDFILMDILDDINMLFDMEVSYQGFLEIFILKFIKKVCFYFKIYY